MGDEVKRIRRKVGVCVWCRCGCTSVKKIEIGSEREREKMARVGSSKRRVQNNMRMQFPAKKEY